MTTPPEPSHGQAASPRPAAAPDPAAGRPRSGDPGSLVVAVDLGGTNVRAALVDPDGRIHHRLQRRTPAEEDRPDAIADLVADLCPPGVEPVEAVVGIPGVIDHDAEALVMAPNLNPAWQPFLTADHLGGRLGIPVSLANDADLAAVGEASFGAGRPYRDVVYVTVSTGVGAGAVLGDRLVRGRHSGLEIGHTVVDRQAAAAGQPATVEQLGAGPAMAKAAADVGLIERDGAFTDLVRAGHPQAVAIWDRAMAAVGLGVTNVAWLLSPGVVVVGGGVAVNNPDLLLPALARQLADHGPATAEPIDVVVAELGDDAALAGAARWFGAVGRRDLHRGDLHRGDLHRGDLHRGDLHRGEHPVVAS